MDEYSLGRLIRLVVEINLWRFDPVVWRRFLLAGVIDSFHGGAAILIERFYKKGSNEPDRWYAQIVYKWKHKDIPALFDSSSQRAQQEGNFLDNPFWLDSPPQDGPVCFSGIERLGEKDYWRNPFVQQMLQPAACGDGLLLACRNGDHQMELHIFRGFDQDPFNKTDRRMGLFLNQQLRCYIMDLAPPSKPSIAFLPCRPRQVMTYLLKGYSEKEVAHHMCLSPQTVHDYVKTIYRHFKVRSRSELTAVYLELDQKPYGQLPLDFIEKGCSIGIGS